MIKNVYSTILNLHRHLLLIISLLLCAQISYAEVELPLGNYHQTSDDITVKVKGGFVKASRTYYKDTWLYNRAWNNLEIEIDSIDGSVKSITRNNNGYDRPSSSSSLYEYDKTKWIRKTASGFRWEDRKGNWIEYNAKGVIQKYGDRNNVEVSFKYNSNGQRTGVFDHFGTQVLWYTYYINGKIETIRDATPTTPRTVKYIYTGDKLTQVIDVRGNTWKYEYSGKRLTKAIDPDGRPTNIAYHANGATKSVTLADGTGMFYGYNYDKSKREYYLSITESSGRVTELWYDRVGDLIRKDINGTTTQKIVRDTKKETETNELGQITIREYDVFDNLTQTTYADGNKVSQTYDTKYSNVLTRINENRVTTKYNYNATGNLIKRTEALGFPEQRITEYTPNSYGEVERMKRVADAVTVEALTVTVFDNQGNKTSITDPEGNSINITKYDLMGRPLEWLDGRNKLWKAEFDEKGQITKITNPLNFSHTVEYDLADNLIKYFNEYNKLTEYKYNISSRVFEVIDTYLNKKQATYNANGTIRQILDEENKATNIEFDTLGRFYQYIDGNSNTITTTYGDAALGAGLFQKSKVIYPTYYTQYKYDTQGRITHTINNYDAKTQTSIVEYDGVGNVIKRTAPDRKTTIYEYDKLNRLKRKANPQLQNSFYTYDSRDNVLTVVNENSIILRVYTYDRNNRVKTAKWPNGAIFSYTYNATGQGETYTDNKNQFTLNIYDDTGRRTRKELYQTSAQATLVKAIDYSYNNTNRLTGYNDGITSSVYEYDDLQRRLTETINYPGFSSAQSYTYYKNNKLKSYTGPDLIKYQYSYDTNNQFAGMTVPGEGAITVNQQQWFNPLKIALPGGSTQNFSYDGLMRNKTINSEDVAANSIQSFAYTYYDNDNIKTRTTQAGLYAGLYSYLYDDLEQLTEVTKPDTTQETFSYDFTGNRITSNSTTGNWQYNPTNQLENDTVSSYLYEENGSLKTKTTGSNVQRFIYNIDGRLSEVQNTAGSPIATYYYDPFGKRLWKEVSGVRTYFMPRKEGIAAELSSTGNVIQTYGYEPNTTWGTKPLITKTSTGTFYYHLDHLGTPQVLTNKAGAKVWQANYSAFGEASISNQRVVNNLRFAGQYYDAETGLHYNYFRDYDPSTGRYMQSDPIGINAGLNTYGYVGGNPLYWVDPYGLAVWGISFGGGGGINGMSGGYSITIALDSNGSATILYTPEAGAGTPGIGGFLRGIGGSGTVDDLYGAGVSVSGNFSGISGSATLPLSQNTKTDCNENLVSTIDGGNPIYELGIGTPGPPGISVTAGEGIELGRSELLGNIGRWIGRNAYNITHW